MVLNIFYYFFGVVIYFVSLPVLIYLSFKKKYKESIPARFFLTNNPPFEKKLHHFHACSLGETKAIKTIVEKFDEVNLSVITNTGFEEAQKYKNANVRFLPFEIFLPFWYRPCKSLVVVEAELWLMLFVMAKKRCQKTLLINARISDKSYKKYLKFKWFYKHLFKYVDVVLAQSEIDKKRLMELGAKNVKVTGNIKSALDFKVTKEYQKPNRELIVAGSTHAGEEEIILNAYKKGTILVIAPRHPERFDEVYELIKKFAQKHNLSYGKIDEGLNKDIVLVDKIGELINLYKIADKVILGGSFVDNVGGHNPLEVAYFNKPLISGPSIFNQKALFDEIENANIIQKEELKEYLEKELKPTFIKRRVNIETIIREIDV